MFVVLDGPLNRFNTETERGLHLHYEFVIDGPCHSVVFIILILGLVEAIPGMLFEALDADAFVWVGHEDF